MTRRKHAKWFDPHAALSALIADLEKLPGLAPEPAAGFAPIAERVDVAVDELKRSLASLHRAEGHSSGLAIVVEDLERIARRATRLAAEHGATVGGEA